MSSKCSCIAAFTVLMVAAAGCAPRMACDVVSFHQLPPPAGETIKVMPLDPKKRGSLEFADYAADIENSLVRLGYEPVATDRPSELVATVDYGVSGGETVIRGWPSCSYRYHFYLRRYHDPFWYGYDCWDAEIYSYTRYLRRLEMTITRADTGEVVFEGRVQSFGRSDRLEETMPYLITALFTNFPGESGVTKTVVIEDDGVVSGARPEAAPVP